MRAFLGAVLAGLVMAGCAVAPASAQPAAQVALRGPNGQQATVTAADLAVAPRSTATMTIHGQTHVYEGVALSSLLAARVGAPQGADVRGPAMADVVIVDAQDGYRVVMGLPELDPGFTNDLVILADRVDGAALPADEGPFRLIVTGDLRAARSVRQVTRIEVRRLR